MRRETGGLLVLTGLVERSHELRAAVAGHPHALGLDSGVQVPAAAMLLEEGVEGSEQFGHEMGDRVARGGAQADT